MPDSSGRATFPLKILTSYAPLSGLKFGTQALLWTKDGDSLTHHEAEAHFGLGTAPMVDELKRA